MYIYISVNKEVNFIHETFFMEHENFHTKT